MTNDSRHWWKINDQKKENNEEKIMDIVRDTNQSPNWWKISKSEIYGPPTPTSMVFDVDDDYMDTHIRRQLLYRQRKGLILRRHIFTMEMHIMIFFTENYPYECFDQPEFGPTDKNWNSSYFGSTRLPLVVMFKSTENVSGFFIVIDLLNSSILIWYKVTIKFILEHQIYQ